MAQATLKIDIWTEGEKALPEGSDLAELFVPHLDHVKGLCEQGFMSGLIIDDAFSGWWSIEES